MLDATAQRIIDWLREIGLTARLAPLNAQTLLPGVSLAPGGLVVDPDKLSTPATFSTKPGIWR
jgi:hypothetical protein